MRKEVLIAIVLGSIIGASAAFFASKRVLSKPLPAISLTQEGVPAEKLSETTETTSPTDTFAVTFPKTSTPVSQTFNIKGTTKNDTKYVLIIGPTNEFLAKVVNTTFETALTLPSGVVPLEVFAIDAHGSTAKIDQKVTVNATGDAPAANSLGISGVITDITQNTIQIRTTEGSVEQLTVTDSTIYKNVIKVPKDIKFTDVAIGDFITAVGSRNGKSVIAAGQVLVDTDPVTPNSSMLYATVESLSKANLTIKGASSTTTIGIGSRVIKKVDANAVVTKATLTSLKSGVPLIITDNNIYVLPS